MVWFSALFSSKKKHCHTSAPQISCVTVSAETQGARSYMEDRSLKIDKLPHYPEISLFGCFDGHGGFLASQFLKDHFVNVLCQNLTTKNFATAAVNQHAIILEKCLTATFLTLDLNYMQENPQSRDGSTALVALLYNPKPAVPCGANDIEPCSPPILVVANAGDCRAVLSRDSRALVMSQDHKPSLPSERRRIQEAGGYVSLDKSNVCRLQGLLSVSRGIGDIMLKPFIIPNPEIKTESIVSTAKRGRKAHKRLKGHWFLLLASDGFWDVFESQEAVDWICEKLDKKMSSLSCIVDDLVQEAHTRGSKDNITAILTLCR